MKRKSDDDDNDDRDLKRAIQTPLRDLRTTMDALLADPNDVEISMFCDKMDQVKRQLRDQVKRQLRDTANRLTIHQYLPDEVMQHILEYVVFSKWDVIPSGFVENLITQYQKRCLIASLICKKWYHLVMTIPRISSKPVEVPMELFFENTIYKYLFGPVAAGVLRYRKKYFINLNEGVSNELVRLLLMQLSGQDFWRVVGKMSYRYFPVFGTPLDMQRGDDYEDLQAEQVIIHGDVMECAQGDEYIFGSCATTMTSENWKNMPSLNIPHVVLAGSVFVGHPCKGLRRWIVNSATFRNSRDEYMSRLELPCMGDPSMITGNSRHFLCGCMRSNLAETDLDPNEKPLDLIMSRLKHFTVQRFPFYCENCIALLPPSLETLEVCTATKVDFSILDIDKLRAYLPNLKRIIFRYTPLESLFPFLCTDFLDTIYEPVSLNQTLCNTVPQRQRLKRFYDDVRDPSRTDTYALPSTKKEFLDNVCTAIKNLSPGIHRVHVEFIEHEDLKAKLEDMTHYERRQMDRVTKCLHFNSGHRRNFVKAYNMFSETRKVMVTKKTIKPVFSVKIDLNQRYHRWASLCDNPSLVTTIYMFLRYIRLFGILKNRESTYGTSTNPTYYDVLDVLSREPFKEKVSALQLSGVHPSNMFGISSTLDLICETLHETLLD